ncbi:murein hydrolase activator EnvC family protein [Aestuariispira insulae]|uniref:Septal ring factor EnvC (AmiA/AmiB activator) n=1 Tax=Aestuariispira insulae TaxID=1461337 RepID=A0A3D9HPN4_9PROT|nr:peptidoglycan DD-metalloendopeptidase family protein [Aestuariispira insulae]RED51271.1 septal ring factor EnvC (AmiA/AmiB activator) [Aestuariispira insulae]
MYKRGIVVHVLSAGLMAGLLLWAGPLAAQDASKKLDTVQERLASEKKRQRALEAKARELAREVRRLREETVSVARQMQERESLVSTLELQLIELRDERAQRRSGLKAQRAQLSSTLGALSRMPVSPERVFFLYPGDPEQAVRSAMLLQAAVPALRNRADILREELDALTAVEHDITDKLGQLKQAEDTLALERARMASLLAQKTKLADSAQKKQEKSQKKIADLVSKAKSLKDLISKLNKARPKPKPEAAGGPDPEPEQDIRLVRPDVVRTFPSKGPVKSPVVGRVVQRYGQDLGYGQTAKGVTVRTRAKAQIVAPHDGQIVFSGPFRDHGLILIIEHPGGYHTVLAGFEHVDVVTGQWLIAGEPVGAMGTPSAGGSPELYVELRREGRPVNPLNWFTAGNIKVHG